MNILNILNKKIWVIIFFLLLPIHTFAISCETDSLTSQTVPIISEEITLGSDLPINTVLYQGVINDHMGGFHCRWTANLGESITVEARLKLEYQGAALGNNIYATNIDGIGIRFYRTSTPMDNSPNGIGLYSMTFPASDSSDCRETAEHCGVGSGVTIRFDLIKTGPINNLSLNTIRIQPKFFTYLTYYNLVGMIESFDSSPYRINILDMNLNVKVASCQTPGDYTVDLGKHEINDIKRNNSSPWVDASIILTGCPTFTGMPGSNASSWNYDWDGNNSSVGIFQNNILEVKLSPTTPIRSASNGTFLIEEGNQSGSGVDIQLNKGTITNNTPIILDQPYNIEIDKNNGSTLKVPLVARYIKNNDVIYPGKATGKVIYLINYK